MRFNEQTLIEKNPEQKLNEPGRHRNDQLKDCLIYFIDIHYFTFNQKILV